MATGITGMPTNANGSAWWVGQDGNVWVQNNDGSAWNAGSAIKDWTNGVVSTSGGHNIYADRRISDPSSGNGGGGSSSGSGGTGGSSGGGSGSSANANNNAAAIALYNALLGGLGSRRQGALDRVNQGYDISDQSLVNDRNASYENLDREQGKIDKQKGKSLGQVQKDIQNLLQSANTQLGMFGAGNSSASGMAAYGASDLSNRETGDITDEYNDQSGDIEYNRGVTTRKYDDEYKKSRVGRQNALANVHQEFDDAENSLRQKIATSSPDAGTAQAQVDAIQSKWGNWNAPSVDLAAQLPEYDGKGVGAKDLAGAVQGPTLTPSQAAQFFSVNRKKDDSETAY